MMLTGDSEKENRSEDDAVRSGDGHMGWMTILWILGAGVVAVIAVIAWDLGKAACDPGGGSNSAEAMIKRRYAKGEIDRDNYQRMLVALKSGG